MQSGLPLSQDPGEISGLFPIPGADLESAHVIQWEQDIIWDGATVAADESQWDDLDVVLNLGLPKPRRSIWQQLPEPLLEPLPSRFQKGRAAD